MGAHSYNKLTLYDLSIDILPGQKRHMNLALGNHKKLQNHCKLPKSYNPQQHYALNIYLG